LAAQAHAAPQPDFDFVVQRQAEFQSHPLHHCATLAPPLLEAIARRLGNEVHLRLPIVRRVHDPQLGLRPAAGQSRRKPHSGAHLGAVAFEPGRYPRSAELLLGAGA